MQGTQIAPVASKIVCSSFSVHGSPSSHTTIVVVPVEQFTAVPIHGMQILPSQSSIVSISFIVNGSQSSHI